MEHRSPNKAVTVVVTVRDDYDIYIGRPRQGMPWGYGNPFEIGRDGDRDEVIRKHMNWLATGNSYGNVDATPERRQWILDNMMELEGKRIACFCKPKKCHGDNYVRIIQQMHEEAEG